LESKLVSGSLKALLPFATTKESLFGYSNVMKLDEFQGDTVEVGLPRAKILGEMLGKGLFLKLLNPPLPQCRVLHFINGQAFECGSSRIHIVTLAPEAP
jgi:hypothetical protein